jgi:diketogulonate reductase-like aldo/keto reductase
VIGARNEEQLIQNLGAIGWRLTDEEVAQLDNVGAPSAPYPYWHQQGFPQLIPSLPSVAD